MRKEEPYLTYDPVNGEYEYFETIEEAREYLQEGFLDDDEGYHPDAEDFKIYKLYEKVVITELDNKENYKYPSEEAAIEANDEEALDKEDYWNHPDHWDAISKHEFKKVE